LRVYPLSYLDANEWFGNFIGKFPENPKTVELFHSSGKYQNFGTFCLIKVHQSVIIFLKTNVDSYI